MRLIWPVLAVFGFVLAYLASTPGVLATGLLLGFVSLFGSVLSLAAVRIESRARPETQIIATSELAELRRQAEARRKAGPPPVPPAA